MERKGQAALEFLTTYGWALLVILVMIGALVYFGILNPNKVLPPRCDFATGLVCKDSLIGVGSTNVTLSNKFGSGISGVSVNVTSADGATAGSPSGCTVTPTTVPADADFTVNCDTLAFAGLAGEKVKINFELEYTPIRGSYAQKVQGTLQGTVQ